MNLLLTGCQRSPKLFPLQSPPIRAKYYEVVKKKKGTRPQRQILLHDLRDWTNWSVVVDFRELDEIRSDGS